MQKDKFLFEVQKKSYSFDYFNNKKYGFSTNDILKQKYRRIRNHLDF